MPVSASRAVPSPNPRASRSAVGPVAAERCRNAAGTSSPHRSSRRACATAPPRSPLPDARAARSAARALSIRRGVVIAYGTGTKRFLRAQCRAQQPHAHPPPTGPCAPPRTPRPRAVLFVAGPHVHILLRLESRLLRRGRPLARPARAPHLDRERGAVRRASASRRSSSRDSFRLPERGGHEPAPGGPFGRMRRARFGRRDRARIPVRLYPKRRVPRQARRGKGAPRAPRSRPTPPATEREVARHDPGMAKARRALLPVTEGKRSIRTFRDARSKALKDDPFFRA